MNHSVSQSVVDSVAQAEGVSPIDLTRPLYEAIDPDALDQLFTGTRTGDRMDGKITFAYHGYDVTVSGDGHVSVAERSG